MIQVSFVVDSLVKHYYQAELLLLSLTSFGQVPHQNVLVQCTSRVDAEFLQFLEKRGYRHRIIEPYLDGKYCNKLRQLDAFLDEAVEGVFLLDADMFVLEPLIPARRDVFCAKIVDLPNPPLTVLQRIFQAAQVPLPLESPTDAMVPGGTTISNNFNGGYYYVPAAFIRQLHAGWNTWGQWLHARPHLFDTPEQAIHTDQVAMALALAAGGIPHHSVAANANCPVHLSEPLRSLADESTVQVLHYHWRLSAFGFIDGQSLRAKPILAAIDKANQAIAAHASSMQFYTGYRRSLTRPLADPSAAESFTDRVRQRAAKLGRRIRLILHAGTPKTGTTSQQFAMFDSKAALAQAGFLYPGNTAQGDGPPKHQWLVSSLLAGDLQALGDRFEEVLDELDPHIHTIVLSTEGLYNHWFDFAPQGRAALAGLTRVFDVSLWAWFRAAPAFMRSYYQQNLKNPQMAMVASYGRDQSMAEMLDDPWVAAHLDYLGFIQECESVFGLPQVRVFNYDEDTVAQLTSAFGITLPVSRRPRDNTGLSAATIAMLRIANRYPLPVAEKRAVVAALSAADAVLRPFADKQEDDPATRERILQLTALQAPVLQTRYGLTTT